jgi:hypothetical protein
MGAAAAGREEQRREEGITVPLRGHEHALVAAV